MTMARASFRTSSKTGCSGSLNEHLEARCSFGTTKSGSCRSLSVFQPVGPLLDSEASCSMQMRSAASLAPLFDLIQELCWIHCFLDWRLGLRLGFKHLFVEEKRTSCREGLSLCLLLFLDPKSICEDPFCLLSFRFKNYSY